MIAVGQVLATVPLAIVVHLLLAFPSGRLATGPSRAIATTGYAVCLLLQAPSYLFTAQPAPYDVLFVADRPDLAAVGADVQSAVGAAVMVATTVVLASRLRRATAVQRRVLAPLYTYGVLAVLWVPLSINVLVAVGVEPLTAILTQVVVLAGLPVAFLLGVLRGGFARTGELEELAAALGSGMRGHQAITRAVAGVLGDPSLEVSYTMPDASQVDADGRPVQANRAGPGRAVVEVDRDGWPVARIAYDTALVPERDHVVAVGRVVAIELDRERLTAELRGRTRDLEHSRARLVRAADDERRRIAQDLHDGLQVQLVLLGLEAGRLGDRGRDVPDVLHRAEDLRRGLDAAAAELRRLVHGLMPAVLVERGLVAALEDLVGLMPLPTTLRRHRRGRRALANGGDHGVLRRRRGVDQRRQALASRQDHRRPAPVPGPIAPRDRRRRSGDRKRGWRRGTARHRRPPGRRGRNAPRRQRPRTRHHRRRGGPVRAVIGEDQALMREGLAHVVGSAGFEVVAAEADAEAMLEAVQRDRPDLVVTDIRMPPTYSDEGLRAALEIRRRLPGAAVLVLSQFVQRRYAVELLRSRPAASATCSSSASPTSPRSGPTCTGSAAAAPSSTPRS